MVQVYSRVESNIHSSVLDFAEFNELQQSSCQGYFDECIS